MAISSTPALLVTASKKKSKSKSEREMQAKKIDELLKKGAYDVFQDDYLEAVTRRAIKCTCFKVPS